MESPKRNRSRSRSPIQRSRSPRRDDRRGGRDRRSGGVKSTKGKEYRVYVNNLNFQVKWMNLKDLMKKIGPVSHVEIFTGQDGKSRGCGVVEFEHSDDAAKAIKEYDGIQHEGRKIHVRQDQVNDSHYEEQLRTQKEKTRRDRDREMMGRGGPMGGPMGGPGGLLGALGNLGGGGIGNLSAGLIQMLNNKNGDPINATVFISNLDYNVRWQEVKDQFRKAGNCKTCTINTEEDTKKSKGYGQAVFESPMEALNAIAMFNGFEMGRDRRSIVVRLDRQAPLNQLLQQIGITEITQNTLLQFQSMALLSQLGGLQGLSALTGGGLAGGLGNLGGAAGLVAALGGGGGGGAQNLQNFQNQSNLGALGGGQNSLQGANNQQGLGGALSSLGLANLGGLGNLLNQSQQGGSSLSGVGGNFGAPSNSQSQYQQLAQGSNMGASNYTAGQQLSNYSITGGRGGGSGYSSQDSRVRSSDIGSGYGYNTGSSSSGSVAKTRVFVRNLPFTLKWQDLKDRFRDAGRIIRADIKQDDNNRSKGCGTVTFETSDEAMKAISMFNGTRIEGREIEVRMDRVASER